MEQIVLRLHTLLGISTTIGWCHGQAKLVRALNNFNTRTNKFVRGTIYVSIVMISAISICACSKDKEQAPPPKYDALPPGFDFVLSGSVKLFEYKKNDKTISIQSSEAMYSTEAGVVDFKNVVSEYYRENRLKYTATGKLGSYRESDQVLTLEQDVFLKSVDGSEATCDKGNYNMETEILDLIGNVVATGNSGYKIETASLTYSFEEEVAVTTAEAKITGDGLTITGIGLRASNKDGTVEVKSNVKLKAIPKTLRKETPPR